ncbi:hypothetical protein ACLQ24_28595, partial [Micromonospora sp. DT4]
MPEIVDADCPEALVTFVPSGMFLSLERTSVPSEVHSAAQMPGWHLVHTVPGTAGTVLAVKTLLAQPSSVVERMVDVPPASVAAGLDLAGAITRANALRLPVRLAANAVAGADNVRVRPIDAQGHLVSPDRADYVLVLPASHLVAERAAATAGTASDLSRVNPDPLMLGELGRVLDETVAVKPFTDLNSPAPVQAATEIHPPTATRTAPALRLRGGASPNERVRGAIGSAFVSRPSGAPVGRSRDGASSMVSNEWSRPGLKLLDLLWQAHRQRRPRPGWQGQPPDHLRLWGRDLFGLRDIPPQPDFLPPSFDTVPTDALIDMFRRLDLTVAASPVNLKLLRRDKGTVWRDRNVTWMGPWADAAARDSSALADAEMPKIVHTFWYGSALDGLRKMTLAFQRTIAESADAAKLLGFTTVLWTTVTREEFRSPDPSVQKMRDWAIHNSILLINVHEIFNVTTPMQLMSEFQLALSKGTPGGYAEGKDISLPEVLHRFGGIGIDGDNVLLSTTELRDVFSNHGFALEYFLGDSFGNSAMMFARRHPAAEKLIGFLQQNYTLHLDELGPARHNVGDNESAQIDFYARKHSRYIARSIMERSGPMNIRQLLAAIGHDKDSVPKIVQQHIRTGEAHSWMPELDRESGALGGVHTGAVQVPGWPALLRAVTYLVRELENRKGDLHLLAVEPLIKDLPDPTAAWEAVVGFLLASPDFSDRIRTATYSRFVNLNDEHDEAAHIELHTIELPPSVRESLGIPTQPRGAPGTHMYRGAFQVPVKVRYRPWLTIDFGKKRTDLDGAPRELVEMADSVAADLRRGFHVDVFVEGGGNGSAF